ncbi:MAG: NAD-dependent deacylase [Phycisphaerales bacterium]
MADHAWQAVANLLSHAKSICVLTGAGVSAESGIPTFRSAQSTMAALWKDFDPMTLATPEAFDRDPETVSKWYDWRRVGCLQAEPNPGHLALAELECRVTARGGSFTLLTQNVDRLHHKAGSREIVELHGSIIQWRCCVTGRVFTPLPEPMTTFPARSPFVPEALARPDVVWFGEMLPETAVIAADEAACSCDLFLSIGTSAVVYPAAGYCDIARRHGARAVEINFEATPISAGVTHTLRARSGKALPKILDLMSG